MEIDKGKIGPAVLLAMGLSLIIARETVLSIGEVLYAFIGGLLSTVLPAGSVPLAAPGELVSIVSDFAVAIAGLLGVPPEVGYVMGTAVSGMLFLARYGR